MIVVLEGPDLAGKTVLAKRISEQLDLEYVKETVYGKAVFDLSLRHLALKNCVIDRCYFTEAIYAKALDRGDRLSDEELWSLGLRLESAGAFVVVLCPSDEVLRQRYEARGDHDVSFCDLLKIAAAYRALELEWWAPRDNIMVLNECEFARDNTDLLLGIGKCALTLTATSRLVGSLFIDAWGATTVDKIVVVGDQRNLNRIEENRPWPFFARRRENCAGYLYEMLRHAGITPNDVFLVNAFLPDGTPQDPSWLDALRPRAVIALGKNAAKWCGKRATHKIDHPQYLYRFWHDFAKENGETLKEDLRRSVYRASQNSC